MSNLIVESLPAETMPTTATRRRCKSPKTERGKLKYQTPWSNVQEQSYSIKRIFKNHSHHHKDHHQDHHHSDHYSYIYNHDDMYSNLKKFMFLFMIIWSSIMINTIYKFSTTIDRRDLLEKPNLQPFMKELPNAPNCSATPIQSDDIDYTLVTHSTEDRLWMMEHHCRRWGYDRPVSIAVFTDQSVEGIYSTLETLGCHHEHIAVQTISLRSSISSPTLPSEGTTVPESSTSNYHKESVLLRRGNRINQYNASSTAKEQILENYPINKLRNVALSNVKTSHVLLLDIDFLESKKLYSTLQRKDVREALAGDDKTAIVVPAFQLNRMCSIEEECDDRSISSMPHTKDELANLAQKGYATVFDPTNKGGHGTTSYSAWIKKTSPGLINIKCIKSKRYEPYVAVRYCNSLPPFQERFNGYGKNKLAWMLHVLRVGYKLKQLDQDFIIHYPHKDSKARKQWNQRPERMQKHTKADQLEGKDSIDWSSYRRGQIDGVYADFQQWLGSEVMDNARMPACLKYGDDTNLWVNKKKS